MLQNLSFPIGEFERVAEVSGELKKRWLDDIRHLPRNLRAAVKNLDDARLDTAYRPGGWSVRQVVHHVADSHLNSYVRYKLALTEDAPTIRPYFEDRWAKLADSELPVEISLDLIENLHARWVCLLENLSDEQWRRKLLHPDSGEWTLAQMLGLYAWHGKHHTAHINDLRRREDW